MRKIKAIIKNYITSGQESIVRLVVLGLSLAILLTCSIAAFSSTQKTKRTDFDSYMNLLFAEQLRGDTLSTHYKLADPDAFGIDASFVSLGSPIPGAPDEICASCENILAACESYDTAALSTDQKLTRDILSYSLARSKEGCRYQDYYEPLNAINGIQAELPILLGEYTFRSTGDVETYLALLETVPEYFSQICSYEEEKAAKGLFMPAFVADDLISQINSLLTPPAFSCLTETFKQKLQLLPSQDTTQQEMYIQKQKELIDSKLVPAYENLRTCLKRLQKTSTISGRICDLADGTDYYQFLVSQMTGSDKTIDVLDTMIADKRHENLSEMKKIIRKHPHIMSESSFSDISYNTAEEMLESLKEKLKADFPEAPDNPVIVKCVAPSMQGFLSPAFYLTAPIDDPDDNCIYINPRHQKSQLELFTTLAHEGYPGHLYETVSTYANHLAPIRHVLYFGGYSEGWATYVEMMSYQYAGIDNTLARLLQLNADTILSLYASIDIGVHHEGWDETVVHEFLCDYGITSEATADHIYRLIIEAPANYLKYYIGYLEFLELKKDARDQFGSDFSNKAFHRAILAIGPAPFSIMKEYLPLYYSSEDESNA
ncbi:MAG: DUF885 domain-containing protein [bacterium]|nr:DUF885 domain-containing protein [bacterium]